MPYTQSMAEPLTTDDIFDPKNLPQEVPESNDLLMFRDISESAPNTIMKVCTPAQAIIDDTTASTSKAYSSSKTDEQIAALIDDTTESATKVMSSLKVGRYHNTTYNGYTITNPNNTIKAGLYVCDANTINLPDNFHYGVLRVYGQLTDIPSTGTQWIFQEFTSNDVTKSIYIRKSIVPNSLTPTNWTPWQRLVTASDKLALNQTIVSSNTIVIRSFSISQLFNQNHVNIAFSLLTSLQQNETVTIGTLNVLPSREFQFAIPFLGGNQIGFGAVYTDGRITLQNITGTTIESWNTGIINITYITA